jgi:hypothetical protein
MLSTMAVSYENEMEVATKLTLRDNRKGKR